MSRNKKVEYVDVIDIETDGKKASTVILSASITRVHLPTLTIKETHSYFIDETSQPNRTRCKDTQEWWKGFPGARRVITEAKKVSLPVAMRCIKSYCSNVNNKVVGNGPCFDNAIVADACREVGFDEPWEYYKNESLRTVRWLVDHFLDRRPRWDIEFLGQAHTSEDDSLHEAMEFIACMHLFQAGFDKTLDDNKYREIIAQVNKLWENIVRLPSVV